MCCAFGQLVVTAASSFENLFELPLSIELVRLLCSDNGTDNILEATLAGEADDALLSLASAILRAVIFFLQVDVANKLLNVSDCLLLFC